MICVLNILKMLKAQQIRKITQFNSGQMIGADILF